MNRRIKVSIVLLIFVLCLGFAGKVSLAEKEAVCIKALIVTGQSNRWHPWKVSSPILEQILEQTGLFKVDVALSPPDDAGIEDYKPKFSDYDVVVLDYDSSGRKGWSEETKLAFVEYVKGGGGVVVYHGANNSFPKWKEYNEITGLGGWGGRTEKDGPMVRYRDGKVVLDNSPGEGGSHGPSHAFQIVMREKAHPICRGLPEKWMHAKDELYAKLRGPAKNLTVLGTAYSDPSKEAGTGEHEPVLFTISYGTGRVFHTTLGHARDVPLSSLECVGFIVTLQRGAEWAATGDVTQAVPEDFPTASEVRRWKNYRPVADLDVDELLGKIATYDYGQSRKSLTELSDFIKGAYGCNDELKGIESRLLEFLKSDATLAGKQFMCRQLSIIGSEQSVGTLASMLVKPETSDMARYALERIPGEAVNKVLREALGKTSGTVKTGIINTLAMRGDKESVGALGELLYDSDTSVSSAAAAGLGRIGGAKAAALLGEAQAKTRGLLRMQVLDSYLSCADGFFESGSQAEAIKIYEELYSSDVPGPIRAAALKGIVGAGSEKSTEVILSALRDDDTVICSVAAGLVREAKEIDVGAIAAETSKLPEMVQVQLLSALGERGDESAGAFIVEATRSEDSDVRIAALKATGSFGTAANVVLLAHMAAGTKGAEREAARESLYKLRGDEVDRAIMGGISKSKGAAVKAELVRSLGHRNLKSGARVLLETVRDTDRNVRLESIRAIREIGASRMIVPLARLLREERHEVEVKEIEKAMVGVSRRAPDKNTKILNHMITTIEEKQVRISLLRVAGELGDSNSLEVIRAALKDEDSDIEMGAIRALSSWPDGVPAGDLLEVVKKSDEEVKRVLALRGYIRLLGLESERTAADTVKLYREAIGLASNASEKKMVLSGLGNVEGAESLDMAVSYIGDKELSQEAEAAVVKIGWEIFESEPEKTRAALEKVLEISKNELIRDEAEELLDEID
jgi:HEAT repeat protein/type 1 glutamine amidotransferase